MNGIPAKSLLFSFVLVASFLLDGCHSGKSVAKSPGENSPQYGYMPAPGNHPGENANKKTKRSGSANDSKREGKIAETYAEKLEVPKSSITNYQLYNFIDVWYGTPYKFGGRSHSGVDCSDFVSLLLQSVYNSPASGAVTALYKQCKPIKTAQLREGDLVFFKINEKSLSHVGVYLQNHKFVHASVHAGVIIDDLGESYYKKYFCCAGRILN